MCNLLTHTLNREGLADRLDACFAVHGAPPVTLLQFEIDRRERPAGERRSSDGDGGQQLAVAAALRSRVRGSDLVACFDDGAVVVGCVGAAPAVTSLLRERLRTAIDAEPSPRVNAGRALSCATREHCDRVLDQIGRVHGAGDASAEVPGAERRRSAAS